MAPAPECVNQGRSSEPVSRRIPRSANCPALPSYGRGHPGDSGGPVFLNDTNEIVGITSFGMNGNCKGADWAYRADIEDTQSFVAGFLG